MIALPAAARKDNPVLLSFVPTVGKAPLLLEHGLYPVRAGRDSMRITTLRFYVSGIQFFQDQTPVWAEPDSYHLIDAAEADLLNVSVAVPAGLKYNYVKFNLGIDSVTNAAGVKGGALDPTKGMYWAWQSGYINLKLEGTSPLCKTRKNEFQFHLGGFGDGNYCMQQIRLAVDNKDHIFIGVDLAAFFEQIDIATKPTVMTPGAEAIQLSKKAKLMFRNLQQL